MVPHSTYGDPECCGLFLPQERDDGAILCTVPASEGDATRLAFNN